VTFSPSLSLPKITSILIGIALFFSINIHGKHKDVWSVVWVYLAIGFLMALVGLFGSIWQPPFTFLNEWKKLWPLGAGVPGTAEGIINANELAGVLCWIAPLMLACVLGLRRRLWSKYAVIYVLLTAATLVTVFLLIATSSRGGILAFTVSAVLVSLFFVTGRWRLVLAIGSAIVILILISYGRSLTEQDIVGDTLGFSGRIEIWSRAFLALSDHPVTGVSVNGFRQVVHVLYPLFGISSEIDIAHAHNHLLQAGLDLGFSGLISYLALWIVSAALMFATIRNLVRRRARNHPYYALAAGLSGSLMAGWVFGIFDAVALGSRPAFMWWILISLTSSLHYAVVYSGKHLRVHKRVAQDAPLESKGQTLNPASGLGIHQEL
jgi:O-antigen ligase